MKIYHQPGKTLDLTAPAAMSSGDATLVGDFLGVAVADIASGEKGAMLVEGVVELPKLAADAFSEGQSVNWDDTAKELKAAAADKDGAAKCIEAAGASTTSVKVKLQP